jgi:hypothetical protein
MSEEQPTAEETGAVAPGIAFSTRLHSWPPDAGFAGLDGKRVADFLAWAYSNLMVNTNRGVLAEYLVANALGVLDAPRVEWNAFDLAYKGKRIEVKAGAYLQAWRQAKLTTPIFGIAPRLPDSTVTGMPRVSGRNADCYVFCLFTPTRHEDATPVQIENWRFYVLAREQLPPEPQKTIGLSALARRACPVRFEQLRTAVDDALGLAADGATQLSPCRSDESRDRQCGTGCGETRSVTTTGLADT